MSATDHDWGIMMERQSMERLAFGLGISCLLLLAPARTAPGAEADKPSLPVPPAAELLGRVRQGHPRLLAAPEEFAQLQQRIAADPQLDSWQTKLREQAGQILAAPPSRYEIPDGLRLLETSRRVVGRVYTLGLLYRLEGKAGRNWPPRRAFPIGTRVTSWTPPR